MAIISVICQINANVFLTVFTIGLSFARLWMAFGTSEGGGVEPPKPPFGTSLCWRISTLPSTSALDGVGSQRHAPAALLPGKGPGTHCIGGWMGPRAVLDGCGKSRRPTGKRSRAVQPVASRYTDYAIPVRDNGHFFLNFSHKSRAPVCRGD